jgi:hypothetical protein
MRAGLRVEIDSIKTEKLPMGWSGRVDGIGTTPLVLDYVDQGGKGFQVKVIEVSPNDTVVVTIFTQGSGRTSSASTFATSSFVKMDATQTQVHSASTVYINPCEMEKKIWSELLEPIGLRVLGKEPVVGPYEDKVKSSGSGGGGGNRDRDRDRERDPYSGIGGPTPLGPGGIGGPLYVPPVGGGGGLGRSDLDPLGGVGTGMIADPRGFRNPIRGPPGGNYPGLPPGARFDPFGPPQPGQGPRPPPGPGPGPPGAAPNWGVPNPDHEQPPPGFEDMFM